MSKKQWTPEDLIPFRGGFLEPTEDGKPIRSEVMPPDSEPLFIAAGPWPYPEIGGRQVRCDCCKILAGVSVKTWAVHQANPLLRPILCSECYTAIWNMEL